MADQETTDPNQVPLDKETFYVPPDFSAFDKAVDEKAGGEGDIETPKEEVPEEEKATIEEQPNKEAEKGEALEVEATKEAPKEKKEAKETEKGEDSTDKAKEKTEKAESEEVDEEIDAIKPNPKWNPATQNQFKELKAIAKRFKTENKAKEAAIKELQDKISTVKPLDQQTEQELNDLRKYRRMLDIHQDPSFVEKYKKGLEKNKEDTVALLKKLKFPEKSDDPTKMSLEYIEKKYGGVDKMPEEDWARIIKAIPNPLEADRLKNLVNKRFDLETEREAEIAKAAEDFEQYQQKQGDQVKNYWLDVSSRMKTYAEKRVKELPDWARPMDIPENATAEQKQKIEAHNAKHQKIEKDFQSLMVRVMQMEPETTFDVVAGFIEGRENKEFIKSLETQAKEKDEEIERLTNELAGIRSAGKLSKTVKPPESKDAPKVAGIPVNKEIEWPAFLQ